MGISLGTKKRVMTADKMQTIFNLSPLPPPIDGALWRMQLCSGSEIYWTPDDRSHSLSQEEFRFCCPFEA